MSAPGKDPNGGNPSPLLARLDQITPPQATSATQVPDDIAAFYNAICDYRKALHTGTASCDDLAGNVEEIERINRWIEATTSQRNKTSCVEKFPPIMIAAIFILMIYELVSVVASEKAADVFGEGVGCLAGVGAAINLLARTLPKAIADKCRNPSAMKALTAKLNDESSKDSLPSSTPVHDNSDPWPGCSYSQL